MTDRINLAEVRHDFEDKDKGFVGYSIREVMLALVQAVEAAHACRTVLEGSPGYWFVKSDELDVALGRFDFEASE
jgi:hypothetical protein